MSDVSNRDLVRAVKAPVLSSVFVLACLGLLSLFSPTLPGIPESAVVLVIVCVFVVPAVVGFWAILRACGVIHRYRGGEISASRGGKLMIWGTLFLGIVTLVIIPSIAFGPYLVRSLWSRGPAVISHEEVARRVAEEMTPPSTDKLQLRSSPVPLEEIIADTKAFAEINPNDDETRRNFCTQLFREAGYKPVLTDSGDVLAVKSGRLPDYVAVGAHYDKAGERSEGILDNMLGCILVSKVAKILVRADTEFTYLFCCYGREEAGRRISAPISFYRAEHGRPTFIIKVDYVGDKRAPGLVGAYLSPVDGYLQTGIKISTYPWPDPPTMHTERDNIKNVDFDIAYLAYETLIHMVEQVEDGKGLTPPPTVSFWRKDKPLQPLD